jgi:diguanylate cyclase (GGDEF)-like protein
MGNELIELGLFKRRPVDRESFVVRMGALSGRLFSLMSDIAVESESLKTSEFRLRLERTQNQLTKVSDGDVMVSVIQKGLAVCQEFCRNSRGYLQEREAEIRQVIDLLREALGTLTGESKNFNQRLTESTTRFIRLNEIEDLRELKKQIADEVNKLARVVAEKKQQDEILYASMTKRFVHLQEKFKQTEQEVFIDALTRVGNRRSTDRAIKRAMMEAGGKPIILGVLDLDDFKKINDAHGHQVGDQALIGVADTIGKEIRSSDFFGRYGGDEFVLVFTNTTMLQAEMRFQQLRAKIEASRFEFMDGQIKRSLNCTVSCGLAESMQGDSAETLVRRADKALYVAKSRGRNCVVAWGRSM